MQFIIPPGTKPPTGHYSPAVVHNDLVYVSGQLPIDPVTGQHETGDIAAQTRLVLNNLKRILEASGSAIDHVLQVTVYTSDVSLWGEINRLYAEFFGNHKPARAVVPTAPLHYGFLIEIAAVAAIA